MQLAGTGLQAFTSMFSAEGQAASYRSQAAADMENARLDRLQGALSSEDIGRRGRATQGEAVAALAEGGGGVGGTSAQDLIFQNSLEIEYAAANARYGAAMEARGEEYKAAGEKRAAKYAIVGGVLGAGAAAISGYQAQQDSKARYNAMFPGGSKMPTPSGSYTPPPSFKG